MYEVVLSYFDRRGKLWGVATIPTNLRHFEDIVQWVFGLRDHGELPGISSQMDSLIVHVAFLGSQRLLF